jgi:hypothetical protein
MKKPAGPMHDDEDGEEPATPAHDDGNEMPLVSDRVFRKRSADKSGAAVTSKQWSITNMNPDAIIRSTCLG